MMMAHGNSPSGTASNSLPQRGVDEHELQPEADGPRKKRTRTTAPMGQAPGSVAAPPAPGSTVAPAFPVPALGPTQRRGGARCPYRFTTVPPASTRRGVTALSMPAA
jgi:hypothetical protein